MLTLLLVGLGGPILLVTAVFAAVEYFIDGLGS